jgi:hypothetical protein
MSDKVYTCGVCKNAEGDFISDNNESGQPEWYCNTCEDNRATKYG